MPAYAPANIDSGIFTLIVHAARNLDAADSDGLSDPFCIVDIRTRTRKYEWFSTNYKRDTLNPEWEVAKEVAVLDFRTTKVRINLFDFDDLSDNDPLGHCLINLQTMFAVDLIRERVWIPVLFDKDTAKLKEGLKRPYHGEVCVSGIFRPQPLVFDDAPPDTSDDVDTEVTGVTSALGKGARLSGKGAKALLTTSRDIMTLKRLRNIGKKHHKVDSATITVRLIEGENLPAMDSTGLSDPYVVGRLGSKQLFQSRVIKTTLNPKWNDTFKAHVSDRYAHPLTLNVRDMNAIGSHSMGEIEISLTDEQSCQGEPKWYPVTGKSHSRGRVLVAVTLVLADSIGQEEELDEDDEDEEAVFDPPSDESSEVLAAATRDRTLTASSQDLDWEGEESMTAHARGSLKRLGKPFKAAAMTIAAMSRGMHHHSDASSASTSTPTTPRQTGAVASIANSASTSSPTTPRQPGANPAAANNASSTAAADAVNAAANAATAMAVTATGATVASATGDPARAGMTNATLFVPGGPVARGPSAESERSGTGIAASPSRHSLAALGAGEMRVARLSAVIIQAKDLSLPDSKGPGSHVPPEAYVKVRAGRSVVYKTSKHKLLSNATVRWDEAFSFASINLALKPVVFQIKEKKALLNSGLIGAHDLSLEAVFPGWQQWLSAQASNAAASPSELKKTIWLQLSPVGRGSLQVSLTLSSVQA
ncbi:hypothetical protein CAOG_009335 [Capsaspora owczarzaki ATCC 30864]|uniref:C2 domain-containing protein n=3 Tax=Capsaspora owczarzaki (strain ATCC 30864) TaxID=595528 RepID=A0A0D2U1Y0_CAPO3|nr:hypothetical protein CAOG_009335 [Capsaspora owczarzaki ATCC 30864]